MYSNKQVFYYDDEPMIIRVWNSIKDTFSSVWGFCTGREENMTEGLYDGRPILDDSNHMVF
jgi:hypothetical protein